MISHRIFFVLSFGLLAACAANTDRDDTTGQEQNELRRRGGTTPAPAQPALPSVCTHNTSETTCLADPSGCAWGDQGQGPECFYVGEIVPFGK